MSDVVVYKTHIKRYDCKKGWVAKKDYDIVQNFKFSGNEFYITKKGGNYFVCFLDDNGDLFSITHAKCSDNFGEVTPGEVASRFRKGYLKHQITTEKIKNFIKDPFSVKQS